VGTFFETQCRAYWHRIASVKAPSSFCNESDNAEWGRPLIGVNALSFLQCFDIVTFRVRCCWGDMYIGHGCLCVCLSLTACPHYCMDPGVSWGMVWLPSSYALLGRFAIGARGCCYYNIVPNAKCQRVLVLALCLVGLVRGMASGLWKICHSSPGGGKN